MREPPKVAALGQDGKVVDRPDAGHRPEPAIVGILAEQLLCAWLDGITLADET